MRHAHDVIVVGGGPGGLYAATLLAREGCDVAVAEEHVFTGEPVHCTGVLATEAFDVFDVPRGSILNSLSTARFFAPSGASISHTTRTTEAVVVDRAAFDRGLHDRATGAGAAVIVGRKVIALDVSPRRVVARCEDGTSLEGRAAVLACGASYAIQRRLGMGMPSVFLQTAQMELPASRLGDVEVYFGRDIAPKGFAWVVPVERGTTRCARVGLMCDRDAQRLFRQFADRVAPAWGLLHGAPLSTLAPRQKVLPLAPIARTYADRVIAVGDAAGLVKATTGGGIYYSLVSAEAGASTLSEALRRDTLTASALQPYETLWQRRLGAELSAQLSLRSLAEKLDDDEIDALFDLARTNGVMPIVRRTARFNHHRELIVSLLKHPPARRLLFKQLVSRTAVLSAH